MHIQCAGKTALLGTRPVFYVCNQQFKKIEMEKKLQILNPLCPSLAKIQIYVYAAKRVGAQIFINLILQAIVYTLTRHRKGEWTQEK